MRRAFFTILVSQVIYILFPAYIQADMWRRTATFGKNVILWSLIAPGGNLMYAGTSEGLFKTTDGGLSWQNKTLSWIDGVYGLLQSKEGVLYACVNSGGMDPRGYVYRTSDDGRTWSNTGPLSNARKIFSLLQTEDGSIYAGAMDVDVNAVVYKSVNSGATWERTGDLPYATNGVNCLLEAMDGAIYGGSSHYPGPVYKTTDKGLSWIKTADFAAPSVHCLLEAKDRAIYAGAGMAGAVFKTIDGGDMWEELPKLKSQCAGELKTVLSLLQDADGIIYAGTGIDIFKSSDGGKNWANADLHVSGIRGLTISSLGLVYAGTTEGIYAKAPTLLEVKVNNEHPALGDTFTVEVTLPPIDEHLDAYAIIKGPETPVPYPPGGTEPGNVYSFVPNHPTNLSPGVHPFAEGVRSVSRTQTLVVFSIDHVAQEMKGAYSIVVALVPTGTNSFNVADAILGYVDQQQVLVCD